MGTPQEPLSPNKVIDRLVDHNRSSERAVLLGALALHDSVPQPDFLIDWHDVATWMLPVLGIPGSPGPVTEPDPIIDDLVSAGRNIVGRIVRGDLTSRPFIRDAMPILDPVDESGIARGKTRRAFVQPAFGGLFTLSDLKALHEMGDLFPPRITSMIIERNRPDYVRNEIAKARDAIEVAKTEPKPVQWPESLSTKPVMSDLDETTTWERVGQSSGGAPILRSPDGTLWKAVAL